MRKRFLFYFLLILALGYGASRYFAGRRGPLFETNLIALDLASITAVSIAGEGLPQQELLLKREGKTWIASQGNRSVKANSQAVKPIIDQLSGIESHHIVTKDFSRWNQFGVGQGQGIRVRVFDNEELLEDFLIGNFTALADSTGYTYLRLWEDEEVYAIEGNLGTVFNPGFDAFRSKALLYLDPAKIRKIAWEPKTADTAIILVQTPRLDSFLQEIRSLQGQKFADSFDPVKSAHLLEGRITFYATDWETPVEVSWFRDTLEEQPFIFFSTHNPDNYFISDSAGIFNSLVRPFYSFADSLRIDSDTH